MKPALFFLFPLSVSSDSPFCYQNLLFAFQLIDPVFQLFTIKQHLLADKNPLVHPFHAVPVEFLLLRQDPDLKIHSGILLSHILDHGFVHNILRNPHMAAQILKIREYHTVCQQNIHDFLAQSPSLSL